MSKSKIRRQFQKTQRAQQKAHEYEVELRRMIEEELDINLAATPALDDYVTDSIHFEGSGFNDLWEILQAQ